MATFGNGRCYAQKAPLQSPPLIQDGKVVIQYHQIGWIVCSVLTVLAMAVSFWLINKHLRSYTNKREQRYIVRILFMVPLYAVISTASYLWWNDSTPLLLVRDGYEATVLASFFYLLLLYISPDPHEQKEIFRKNGLSRENDRDRRRRGEPVQKWMLPLGFVTSKPQDGLYFLQMMKWGVLQYCVVLPCITLSAVILDYVGLYCEDSWSPGWGHIYITVVQSVSVSIAMYCLLQLYMSVKVQLAPQRPLLKLFAVKAVVFLTFWQSTLLSLLITFGIVKDTPYMTAENINIGIGAILETFEMALFACLHIKAFSYKPYYTDEPTPRFRCLVHAMNFKETIRELWQGLVYMIRKSRGHEVDTLARREAALENVFGRSRYAIYQEANGSGMVKASPPEKDLGVTVQVEKEVRVGDERQWLGIGDDYVYGLGYQARRQRERSEGLESQIEKELAKRGYAMRGAADNGTYAPIIDEEATPPTGHQRAQRSWWQRMYNRISQSGPDTTDEPDFSPRRRSSSRRRSKDVNGKVGVAPLMADVQEDDYNDPPPPSAIRTYRESREKRRGPKRVSPPAMDPPLLFTSFGDIPSPLSSPEARDDNRMMIPRASPQERSSLSPTQLGIPPMPLLTPPPLSPSVRSTQGDSFLDRAFAASVEPGSSTDILSTGTPSSQSHHGHVKLGSVPVVDTRTKAQPQLPVVVNAPAAGLSNSAMYHQRVVNDYVPPAPAAVTAVLHPSPSNVAAPSTLPAPTVPLDQRHTALAGPSLSSTVPPNVVANVITPPPTPLNDRLTRSPPQFVSPERRSPLSLPAEPPSSRRRSSHRRDSAQFFPEPGNFSPPPPPAARRSLPPVSPSSPQSSRLQRAAAAYSRGTRRNSGTPQSPPQQHPSSPPQFIPQYPPTNRFIPTRDRIVLPAPLSSGSPSSPLSATSPTRPAFANARYTPPGLPTSPPPRSGRRMTGPRSFPPSDLTR